MPATRLLIAALGGEGGGVLTSWVIDAAQQAGLPAQATSVPGVAQRTGATTYYLEIWHESAAQTPVFALMPVAGDVDVVLASELLEAARMVEKGYSTSERTCLVASTHRVLTTQEKMARGDGRLDAATLMRALESGSKSRFLFDAQSTASAANAPINAVLLGALATTDMLPVNAERLRDSIARRGVAVSQNLRGFDAGLALTQPSARRPAGAPADKTVTTSVSLQEQVAGVAEEAREVARLGIARLTDYQDSRYARQYLERLQRFVDDPELQREVARNLAVRMSYEDIIRVAQLKIKSSRFERIREELGAQRHDPIEIQDFFKPGIAELADILPPRPGRRLLALAQKKNRQEKAAIAMRVKTTTVWGFLQVWWLAKLRPWRRRSFRFQREQKNIDEWLNLVGAARELSPEFAMQTAQVARVLKGYGDTYSRGEATYLRLVEDIVRPALRGEVNDDAPHLHLRNALAEILAAP